MDEIILDRVLRYMRRTAEQWQRYINAEDLEFERNGEISDEYVRAAMEGHALFDDPGDLSERDLLMYGRGYLHAEAIQYMNCATILSRFVLSLELAAARLMPEPLGRKRGGRL